MNTAMSRPSQQAHNATKGLVPMDSSGDAKTSCMDVESQ